MSSEDQPKIKPPFGRRAMRGIAMLVILLGLMLGAGLAFLTDTPLNAPDWLRRQVEARLDKALPGAALEFGDMVLTVRNGWRPKVDLRDVRLRAADGRELLAVSEVQVSLAMRPLLRRQVQPKTVDLAGIFATLRRDEAGRLTLIASDAAQAVPRQAANLADLVEQVDALFLRPELAALMETRVDGITLRIEDAMSHRAWTIDGARMRLTRQDDALDIAADLALLSGGADVATMAANYTSQIGSPQAQFGVTVADFDAHDFAAVSPAFAWLDALRAPVSGALRGGIGSDGALQPINATLQIAEGALQPTEQTRPIKFKSARTYFTFDPVSETLRFDELSLDSKWLTASGDGVAMLEGLSDGRLDALVGQFRISDIAAAPPDLFPEPIRFEGAEFDFRLIPSPFRFDLGQLRLIDEGQSLRFDGGLTATPEGWDLAVNGRMDEVTPARLLELWPAAAASKTRRWLSENLRAGHLTNIDFALRSRPDTRPDTFLSFDFDETELRYVKTMPHIFQARGVGTLLRDRLVIAVEDGHVDVPEGGRIEMGGSSFIIPDVTVKDGVPAIIRLRTRSSIAATLSLLDHEPLQVMAKAGLPVTLADGRAEAETTLALPLRKGLKAAEVRFDVAGTLRDVDSRVLVKGRRLTAPSLRLRASNEGVEIAGKGALDGVGFDGRWQQPLGTPGRASTVTARVAFTEEAAQTFGLGLPPGALQGKANATLKLELVKGRAPDFALSSDLKGMRISIPALGWRKAAESGGSLEISGALGAVPRVDKFVLDAPGLSATGDIALREGGGLERARFSRVRVGNWLDAPVELIGRGKGAPVGVSVTGGNLDMRKAEFGKGGGGGEGGPLTLALNELRVNDTIALTDMRGQFDLKRGLQGRFTGRVNGAAPVSGQVEPRKGRSAFLIRSEDAGAVFKAAGLLKQARGGTMSLVLQPVGSAGAFNGSLRVENTRVKDAPAIAELFNALSVVGLLEQMGGQGLHFAQVDAAFRLTPDLVTLTQASATGPSIGLSMDGTYDVNTGRMDMQGVFSPLYLINGVGSVLTRRGEGLIGFNFRLVGPSSKPKVQVNPLSALTPGLFREIFRRPPPKVRAEPGETVGSSPKTLNSEPKQRRKRVGISGPDR